MTSESEETMKLVTNLDRKAIEGKLAEVRSTAQAANLKELADLFNGVEGMPRAQIEQKVKNALKWLGDKPAQSHRFAARARRPESPEPEVNLRSSKLGFDYDLFTIGGGSGGVRASRVRGATAPVAIAEEGASAAPASTSAASRRSSFPTPRISARSSRSPRRTAGRRASRASTGRRCSRTRTARSRA